ncbi:MAG: oxidoreductase [Myxococcaceae bacterium]|nr:oxidoreductase [Myxococcaceae bacterium]
MSPYSYLASTQVEAIAERTNATLRWRPLYLPGVLKATGNTGPTSVAAKAMYAFKDVNDWAQHYRLPPIELPDNFPFTAVLANRVALVAEEQGKIGEYSQKMFTRIWSERADCNDPAMIAGVLGQLGLDAEAVIARAGSDDIKARLKANTEEAVERGAFGVPTFYVGEEMFVGNDRLTFVEQALKR